MKRYGSLLLLALFAVSSVAIADIPVVHPDKDTNLHDVINTQAGTTGNHSGAGLINCQVDRKPPCQFKPVGVACKGPSFIHCGALGVGCTTTCENTDLAMKPTNTNRKAASVKKTDPAANTQSTGQ